MGSITWGAASNDLLTREIRMQEIRRSFCSRFRRLGVALFVVVSTGIDLAAQVSCELELRALDTFEIGPNSGMIALDDLDRDGDLDLFTGNELYRGDATGSFTSPLWLPGAEGFDASTADFDGDGLLDIAVVGFGTQEVTFFWGKESNDPNDFLDPQNLLVDFSISESFWHMAQGDFNGDDRPDLVLISIAMGVFVVLQNEGERTFSERPIQSVLPAGHMVTVGDFNGDGNDDIAAGFGHELNLFPRQGRRHLRRTETNGSCQPTRVCRRRGTSISRARPRR